MRLLDIYWRRRLTRLEVALYAAVAAALVTVFLERALLTMEVAERTAMEMTVNNVNSALNVQIAVAMLQGHPVDRRQILQRNPFEVARMNVPNAHPDITLTDDLSGLERGYWVFDRSRKELIYLPQLHRGLHTNDPQAAIRFHLEAGQGLSFVLAPIDRYRWGYEH